MAMTFTMSIDSQGNITEVKDENGNPVKESPRPGSVNPAGLTTVNAFQAGNPMCWISVGGRWFKIPC